MYETDLRSRGRATSSPVRPSPSWESGEAYESEAETLETELVQELLEITTEAELERFLGKLASSVVKGASSSSSRRRQGARRRAQERRQDGAAGGRRGARLARAARCRGPRSAPSSARWPAACSRPRRPRRWARWRPSSRPPAATSASPAARTATPRGRRATCRRGQPSRAAGVSAARRYAPGLLGSDQRRSPWRSRRRSYGGGRSRRSRRTPSRCRGTAAATTTPGRLRRRARPVVQADDDYESGEGEGEARAPGGSGARATSGRWVRRGGRIVLLGA